jgi:hypothetical protein
VCRWSVKGGARDTQAAAWRLCGETRIKALSSGLCAATCFGFMCSPTKSWTFVGVISTGWAVRANPIARRSSKTFEIAWPGIYRFCGEDQPRAYQTEFPVLFGLGHQLDWALRRPHSGLDACRPPGAHGETREGLVMTLQFRPAAEVRDFWC